MLAVCRGCQGGAGGIVPFVLSEFSVSSHGGCRGGRRPWSLEAQWRGIAGTYTKCNRSRGLDLWGHGLAAGITGRQRPKRMDRNSEQRAEVEAALRPLRSLRWYRQCSWQLWQGLQRLMCACWFVSLVFSTVTHVLWIRPRAGLCMRFGQRSSRGATMSSGDGRAELFRFSCLV